MSSQSRPFVHCCSTYSKPCCRSSVVGAPDPLRGAAERRERDRAFRISRGEEHAHVAALRRAEDRGALGADAVHHGADVVHPLFQRRQLVGRDGIGHPGAALVEQDQARERGETLEAGGEVGQFPGELDVRDPAGHVDQVYWAVADDLVGDVDVPGLRVARVGRRLHGSRFAEPKARAGCSLALP
jgi:phage terminase large subunit-like protein